MKFTSVITSSAEGQIKISARCTQCGHELKYRHGVSNDTYILVYLRCVNRDCRCYELAEIHFT